MWWTLLVTGAWAMTVDQAVDAAVARSPVLDVGEARIDEARARVNEVRGVLLPTATLTGSATAQTAIEVNLVDQLGELPIPIEIDAEPLVVQPGFQLAGGAQVVLPLIAPTGWSAQAAAREGEALARAEAAADRQRVVGGVVGAWHASAEAHALLGDATRAEELATRLVERGQALVDAGAAPRDALLPFQRAQATARANLALATEAARATDGVLGQLTGLPGHADLPGGASEAPDLGAVLDRVDRPDLQAADARAEAAQKQVGVQRGGMLPTVAAFAGIQAVDPAPDLGEPVVWRAGVQATIPLFQGGQVAGRVSQARARASQAEAGARVAQEQAELEVRMAHGALARSLAALGQEEESVRLAQAAVTAAEARLGEGGGSLLQLQQAQMELLGAEARRTRATLDAARARASLALAASGDL